MITTSSYQLSIDLLQANVVNLSVEEARALIKKSVQVAIEARDESGSPSKALVAGAVGSYGASTNGCSEFDGTWVDALSLDVKHLSSIS